VDREKMDLWTSERRPTKTAIFIFDLFLPASTNFCRQTPPIPWPNLQDGTYTLDLQNHYERLELRSTGPSGQFKYQGLESGKYVLLAFSTLPKDLLLGAVDIADFIRPYQGQATPLIVTPGKRTNVNVPLAIISAN